MLKIAAGKFRRHKLKVPIKKGVRPIERRLRLQIFNYLADFVENAKVLDLFAGSGSFGIEAISRGAFKVVFVDKVAKAVYAIKNNLQKLHINSRAEVVKNDALKYLIKAKKLHHTFDIIFLDPPFDKLLAMKKEERTSYLKELLSRAFELLNPKSIIILKMHKKIEVPIPQKLVEFHSHTSGINKIYYLLQKKYVH